MDQPKTTSARLPVNEEVFAGNGEMAALMRAMDWSKTPLGPPTTWPQSLKTVVRILLTSRFAMWMGWGPELTFFYNDAYGRETLGVKHPWALGQPANQVWAEIWTELEPRIAKVLQTGEATWDEALLLFLERSGYTEETYHTFSYSPLANDSGEISGMLCVVTEETQRVIGERRLGLLREAASALASAQTREEVFAGVAQCIEASPEDLPFTLLYLFEDEGSVARLVRTTGVPVGHPIAAPVIGEDGASTPWPIQSLLDNPVAIHIDNLDALFGDLPVACWDRPAHQAIVVPIANQGQERPAGFLAAGLNPYRKFDEDYAGFVNLLAGQIASRLANAQAYEEERRRAEALAEIDRAKTVFFSNVSHEFRTPLTLMLGPIEDALSDSSAALKGQGLEIVHRNGLRLLKLVNTLLDFSRIEAGRVQASYEPTDLAVFTQELASVFRSAIEKAGMRFVVNCQAISEPVFIDRDMWEKVVFNLLSNAFKFTLEGEIAITLTQRSTHVELAIRDTGAGIPDEQIPHIFERFHRVEGSRARTHEGTGIGLALVQELVKLHGGTVAVQSRLGEGTTFTVSLPLGKAHLPAERISARGTLASTALRSEAFVEEALRWLPEENRSDLPANALSYFSLPEEPEMESAHRARIVLADDNADMREYVRQLLQPLYEVIAVSNGGEALRAARNKKPDLVLSDVMMPELDGFGLLQALRNDPYTAGVPVIMLSARAGEEARIEGLTAGADDYLTKPFSARELMARVSAHLELARTRREAEQVIRDSEERFRVALSNVPLTVFTCDRELRYTWAAKPSKDFQIVQILGKRDDELMPPEEAEPFIAFKQSVLQSKQAARQEISHVSASGTTYYDMTAEPLYSPEGDIAGLTVAAFDITELKQYELTLAAMNARLQRAMTETHHRVKNNLQLISALIDMRQAGGEEMVPMSDLARIGANVRALGVIHDILTREAKQGNDQETLSIRTVLEQLVGVLAETTGGRPLKSEFEEARLDGRQATALALVTNELVANALKHGVGETEIYAKIQDGSVILEVCDDGPGFPENFDPLMAANTGLELVENVVNWDLRGKTSYETRPGGGARCVVTFPLTMNM